MTEAIVEPAAVAESEVAKSEECSQGKEEDVKPVETEAETETGNGRDDLGDGAIDLAVKLPGGGIMRIPLVQTLETVSNVKQLILDIPQFSHVSCCHLEAVPANNDNVARKRSKKGGKGQGVILNEYSTLGECEELMQGFHVKVVQDKYNHQAVIDHVKRLQHILEHPPTPLVDEQREFDEESEPEKEEQVSSQETGSGGAESGTKDNETEERKGVDSVVEEKKDEDESILLERRLDDDIHKHHQMHHSDVHRRLRKEQIPLKVDLSSFYTGKNQDDAGIYVDTCSGMLAKGETEGPVYAKCVTKLQFSAWNPPPAERTMMGDLAYLEVSTAGEPGLVYNITATARGFFINSTRNGKFNPEPSHHPCHSPTLLELLQKASPSFRKDFTALLKHAADLARQTTATTALSEYDLATLGHVVDEPSMDSQGLVPKQWNEYIPEHGRTHEARQTCHGYTNDTLGLDRSFGRDWNEEYQASIEMPSSTTQEKILRCRAIDRAHKDFVDTATKAAIGIMRGHISPMNPADPSHAHVFVYNQIFFSLAKPEPTIPRDEVGKPGHRQKNRDAGGGIPQKADDVTRSVEAAVASYSVSNHDLLGVRSLNESMELLRAQANVVRSKNSEGADEIEKKSGNAFNKVEKDSLKTLMTAVVDYMGQRIIAQSIIPGILHSDHHKSVVHGSVDYGETIVSKPEVESLWEKAMAPWFVSKSEVRPRNAEEYVEIVGPVESKAINGSDGRVYALDLLRFTPFDLNYYNERTSQFASDGDASIVIPVDSSNSYVALLRPELIRHFSRWRESKHQQRAIEAYKRMAQARKEKQAAEAGNDEESGSKEEEEKLKLEPMEPIRLDLNAYTAYAQKATPELEASKNVMLELAAFLLEIKLPSLLEEVRRNNVTVADGETLTKALHTTGINLRYLGKFAEAALEAEKYITKGDNLVVPPACPAIFELCEVEMIARCVKWILRHKFRSEDSAADAPAVMISSLLNDLFANVSNDVWAKIAQRLSEHYGYESRIWGPKATLSARRYPLVLLRRVCQVCGIQIASKKYSFEEATKEAFKPQDVIDMVPVVKSSVPDWPILEAKDRLESAKLCLAGKEPIQAYKRANEALTLVTEVAGSAHKTVVTCCVFAATILNHLNDPASALVSQRRALALLERMGEMDTAQAAHVYSNVGMLFHAVGQSDAAIPHIRRSIYLLELMGGPYVAEVSTLYLKMASIYVQVGKYQPALQAVNEALIRAHNDQLQQALCRTSCAHIFAVGAGRYGDAFKQQKVAYDLYKQLLGADHVRTVEVAKWMQVYIKRNVEIKQREQKTRDLEEQHSEAKKEIKAKKAVKKARKKRK